MLLLHRLVDPNEGNCAIVILYKINVSWTFFISKKDMDVNGHKRLFNITLRHKYKYKNSISQSSTIKLISMKRPLAYSWAVLFISADNVTSWHLSLICLCIVILAHLTRATDLGSNHVFMGKNHQVLVLFNQNTSIQCLSLKFHIKLKLIRNITMAPGQNQSEM